MCHSKLGAQVETTTTHWKILAPLESNFEVDSTLY